MSAADVVIVGAGPAGSVTATLLARRGFRVVLIDRARFPRDKPCGDYCNPGAVRTLEAVGCLQEVMAGGAASIGGMTVTAQDGSLFQASFPSGAGLLFPRRHLDATLLAYAANAGATVVEGVRIYEVQIDGDGVRVRSDAVHDTPFRARLLIAADGMHSMIARRLGLLRPPPSGGGLRPGPDGAGLRPLSRGRYTVGAYFSGLPYDAPCGELHLGPDLYCGVAHFGGGVANVCMALPRPWLRRRTPEQAFVAALHQLPVLADALAGATRESGFRCTGQVGFAMRRVVAERTMLVGDAAGQIEPMTGQGISHALRSAWLAADTASEALERNDLSRTALLPYALQSKKEMAPRMTVARWLERLALRPHLTPALVRRLSTRPGLASQLLGATGDILPPGTLWSPEYLTRFVVGLDAHSA